MNYKEQVSQEEREHDLAEVRDAYRAASERQRSLMAEYMLAMARARRAAAALGAEVIGVDAPARPGAAQGGASA